MSPSADGLSPDELARRRQRRAAAPGMRSTGRTAQKRPKRLRLIILRRTDLAMEELAASDAEAIREGNAPEAYDYEEVRAAVEATVLEQAELEAQTPDTEEAVCDFMALYGGSRSGHFSRATRQRREVEGLAARQVEAMTRILSRHNVGRVVLISALLQTPAAKRLLRLFSSPHQRRGVTVRRPLASMAALWMMFSKERPTLKYVHEDLTVDNRLVQRATGYVVARQVDQQVPTTGPGLSYGAFQMALCGRSPRAGTEEEKAEQPPPRRKRTVGELGIFDFHSTDHTYRELTHSYADLAATGLWPNTGVVWSVDGTALPAPRLQHGTHSKAEELEVEDYQDGSALGMHHKRYEDGTSAYTKIFRGRRGIILVDGLMGTQAAIGCELPSANRPEKEQLVPCVARSVDLLRQHPFWDQLQKLNFVVGDGGFADRKVAAELLWRFGVTLCTPYRGNFLKETAPWADNYGIPQCEHRHSGKVDAALVSVTDWPHPNRRREQFAGTQLGDDLRHEFGRRASRSPRINYRCTCGREWALDPRGLEHIYSPLPYRQVQHPAGAIDRYAVRQSLLTSRNRSESINSLAKRRGLGLTGDGVARWLASTSRWQHMVAGRLLSMNLERLVAINGDLDAQAADLRPHQLARTRELLNEAEVTYMEAYRRSTDGPDSDSASAVAA